VPDVALNSNPSTGYIIKCTDAGCPRGVPWFPVGGTSPAEPLMAAITADANEYALANGGGYLGYANPCLYGAGPGTFMDVTSGNNAFKVPGSYPAGPGFDLATGLGSPEANGFAAMVLACSTHGPAAQTPSVLTATTPKTPRSIRFGDVVTFQGNLTVGGAPMPSRAVYLELTQGPFIYLHKVMTDANGHWAKALSKALRRNTKWRVFFPGSDTERPAKSAPGAIYVRPTLTNAVGSHSIRQAQFVRVSGRSRPNMRGQRVALQIRRSTASTWRTAGLVPVRSDGTYRVSIRFGSTGTWRMRWHYAGGTNRAFLAATSPVQSVLVR